MERNKGRESEKGGKVMLERYGWILSLLSSFDVESLCNDISSLLSFDWFYGERETKEISMALSEKPNGTFCVRFSNNPARKSCYVLSRLVKRGFVHHLYILHSPFRKKNLQIC